MTFAQRLITAYQRQEVVSLEKCRDGVSCRGQNGVDHIMTDRAGTVEYLLYADHVNAFVPSSMGYPAYYPVPETQRCKGKPLALLMDLDGTTVHSETFWIEIIQSVVRDLLHKSGFQFQTEDLPYVSGHSVSEHLSYCLRTYCPNEGLEHARQLYFFHTRHEMKEILAGRGRKNAFEPAPGLKDFLLEVKNAGIRIGLVTSGLYEKA